MTIKNTNIVSESDTKLNKKPRLTKELKLKYANDHLEYEIDHFKDNIDEYIYEYLLSDLWCDKLESVEAAIDTIRSMMSFGFHQNTYSCHKGDPEKKEYERKVFRIIALIKNEVEPHPEESYYLNLNRTFWEERVNWHLEGEQPLEFNVDNSFGWDYVTWTQEQEDTFPKKLRVKHNWLDTEKYPNGYKDMYPDRFANTD